MANLTKALLSISCQLFLLFIAFFLVFIYTAHKDHLDRLTIKEYQPTLYKKHGKFTYNKSLPLQTEYSIDNIFLSLVFPAYNEVSRLPSALSRTIEYFEKKNFKYEILLVNDGSKDKTEETMLSLIKTFPNTEIIVVTYKKNGGKGYAVRTGMQYARGEYIWMLDSDGATDIRDYDLLYGSIKNDKYSIAIGSRKIISEQADRKWYRNVLGIINNFIVKSWVGVGDIKDTQCGFKLFTRRAAKDIFMNMHWVRWAFDVEMLYITRKKNIKVNEIAVNWKEIEGSKLVLLPATISFFRDYFALIVFYNTGFWKIEMIK